MKIKISRGGFLWWFLSGGPLGELFWLLEIILAFLGIGTIISGDTLAGIAYVLLLPATLLISTAWWLGWSRAVKPAVLRVARAIFELKD